MIYFAVYSVLVALTKASQWSGINITLALVEYYPLIADDALAANTQAYEDYITSVTSGLDLIIFPENTLTRTPTDAVELKVLENPCSKDSYPLFIRNLSCTISDSNRYAVINLIQKIKCASEDKSPNCKTYGSYFYNTNVVFDRSGTIIGLYQKYNALGEKLLSRPSVPEEVTIETDFGLTLGISTGSEILFKRPADQKVDAIVYPTQWYSELPFLTALQTQQMWSHAHNIKLFAAGANDPQVGSGGSGVFSGAEDSDFTNINWSGSSTILIYSRTQIDGKRSALQRDDEADNKAKNLDKFHLNIDPNITEYTSTVLDTTENNFTRQVCHDGGEQNRLCCNFTIKITTDDFTSDKDAYTYHMVAFSGMRPFVDVPYIGVEFCAIIACLNSSLSSCGQRFPSYDNIAWPLTFEEITIKANFESSENKTQYPNSLLSSIRPVPVSQTRWEKEEVVDGDQTTIQRTFALAKPQDRLLTFAIFGRNFGRDFAVTDDNDSNNDDDKDNNNNSVRSIGMDWSLLIYTTIVLLKIFFTHCQ